MSASKDLACILKSLQLILEAQVNLQRKALNHVWRTSNVRPLIQQCTKDGLKAPDQISLADWANCCKDGSERISVVVRGIKAFTDLPQGNGHTSTETLLVHKLVQPNIPSNSLQGSVDVASVRSRQQSKAAVYPDIPPSEYQIKLSQSDKELLRKLDMEHRAKLVKQTEREQDESPRNTVGESIKEQQAKVAAVPNSKTKLKLSDNAKQRKVPSSRIGRMMSFGSLAAGLGVGTAAEYLKQTFKIGDVSPDGSNLLMSKANLDRIVDTLCKVRGAALKLGQILSIQDESVISPDLAKALERVRSSADFMPDWQVDQVLGSELGDGWEEKLAVFERKPFAAASIGQVHYGKLKNGQEVAIKIQYPGVARGIESDIDNLGGILKMWNIFPKGMFLENLMAVAKRELAWEVDYLREAECTKKFKALLTGYDGFYVPVVLDDLSTKQIFTTELLDGVPLDQCFEMEVEHRQVIGEKIMELVLLEILRFKYMQTDPNWANFLYNPAKKQLLLLDFGASREYSKEFMDKYVQVLKGACDGSRDTVLNMSKEIGFLTGYESKVMEDAHVDAVMILGEIFRSEGKYDFAHQDMTLRIQNLAQTMLVHRLCPPPEEVYSLHRKLSGVFLLLSKLRVQIECRQQFLALYEEYMRLNPPQH
ncbi:atypical kinase COQ8B, mitochondrial [Dendroctonus ponderosae]|uniref:atypical kinase COQ8B, mitochondrial n=1 Tax=Dendroctonus ponderosae TaxID=77166 RepID=UPI002034D19E|nr:atypical kinase COQ8B, mitochondrial [Dendroctonus ponderosae]